MATTWSAGSSNQPAAHTYLHLPPPPLCLRPATQQGPCSGDDWECWKPAQINLLHTLASASVKGCVLVLVGDFHYADIKLVMPGADTSYSQVGGAGAGSRSARVISANGQHEAL